MNSDDLELFEREDRISSIPSGDSLISLHDVTERGVSVHWDEAVAIVEEFCHVAIAESGETASVPDLDNVLIGSDGRITLRRTRGDKSPTAAGRMLHTLVSGGDVPMPLRLFITQSISQDTHRSLREFARGLAYFGKPARERLIQDVYSRCAQAGRRAPDAPPVLPPLPNRVSEAAKEPDRQQKSKRRSINRWVFATAALALAGSAVWLWRSGRSAQEVHGSAARVLSEAADVLSDLGQQVRDKLGAPAAVPSASAAEPKLNSESKQQRRASSRSVANSDVEPAPLVNRQVSRPRSAGAWQLAAAVPHVVASEPAAVYEQLPEHEREPEAVYSSADQSVEPPVLLFPQLPPPLVAPGASAAMMNRMVVLVSSEGTVERVQLVEGPARLPDMMLLSGAKTWRFTPASKDGEPVRYRTVISWAALP
jgi:hypothetical protein